MKTTHIVIMLFFSIGTYSCEQVFFAQEPSNDPIGNFESLWQTFNERYAVFEQRGVDWQALYDQYRPMINASTTDEELFDVITGMLSHLDDAHVSLMANGRNFWNGKQDVRDRIGVELFSFDLIRDNYMDGPMTIINNQYAYGTINNEIGYLYINALGGDEPGFIDDFILRMKDMKGIIVDVRHDDGGDFTNGEVIVSRFAGESRLAFSGTPKNGPGPNDFGETTDYFIQADGPLQFTKPVVVLANNYTFSAAENVVLYFRVLPNATIVGGNTIGAMGERVVKEMPNGWNYSITGQIITAADGNVYEGPGIPPDIRQENSFSEIEAGIDRILDRGIEIINE